MMISRLIFIIVRIVAGKICRETQYTHFIISDFFSENRAVCEIMWKNMVEPDWPQIQLVACAFHTGYIRLQIYSHNI